MKFLKIILILTAAAFADNIDVLLDSTFKSGVDNTIKIVVHQSACTPCSFYWMDSYHIQINNILVGVMANKGDTVSLPYDFPGYYAPKGSNRIRVTDQRGETRDWFYIDLQYSLMESAVLKRLAAPVLAVQQVRYLVNGCRVPLK